MPGRRQEVEAAISGNDTVRREGPGAPGSTGRVLTIPNVLSGLRLASVPVFVWLFVSGRENGAVILFGVAAWTDFFDGLIARATGQVSDLGKLLDPLSDRVLILALAVALVARGTLAPWLAAVVIVRDVVVLGAFPVLERRGVPRIPVNFTGKTATGFLFLGLTLLAWSETTFPAGAAAATTGLGVTIAGAVLYWIAGAMYARAARARLRERAGGAGDSSPNRFVDKSMSAPERGASERGKGGRG